MATPDITLYQFPPAWGLPNASPFCMKVETFLRMAGLAYRTRSIADPRKAPRGKLPYITDGAETVADSALILDYLTRTYALAIDDWLTPQHRAQGLAFQRMLEEATYWPLLYFRWVADEGFEQTRGEFMGSWPGWKRTLVGALVRRQMRRALWAQGTGRHVEAFITAMVKRDLEAISVWMGDRPYVLGDKPSSFDASFYGFLANVLDTPTAGPVADIARGLPNLRTYVDRMQATFFPELVKKADAA
jgi:glutathione S-transferase